MIMITTQQLNFFHFVNEQNAYNLGSNCSHTYLKLKSVKKLYLLWRTGVIIVMRDEDGFTRRWPSVAPNGVEFEDSDE